MNIECGPFPFPWKEVVACMRDVVPEEVEVPAVWRPMPEFGVFVAEAPLSEVDWGPSVGAVGTEDDEANSVIVFLLKILKGGLCAP
jgi:hypothetical protein